MQENKHTDNNIDKSSKEQLLENTQKNLEIALKTGNVSAWRYDIQQQSFTSIMGNILPKHGISLQKSLALLHPDDREHFTSLIEDIISAKVDQSEIMFRFLDRSTGEYIYYESHMAVRFDENGNRTAITGTQRDITDKFLQKQEIDNARRSLDMVLATSKVQAWDYDVHTKKTRTLYGEQYSSDSGEGHITDIGLHPDDIQPYEELAKLILSGEKDKDTIEVRIKEEDGVYRYFECTIANIRNKQGKITHLIGSKIDISERREREKSERDMQSALEIMMNAGAVSMWKYIITERRFYAMLGAILMPDGTTFEECAAAISSENKADFYRAFDNLLSGKTNKEHATLHFIAPETGEDKFYRNEMAVLFDDNAERTAIIGTQRDVTDDIIQKKQLEEFRIKTRLTNEKNNIIQWDYDIKQQVIITHGNGAIQDGIAMDQQTYLNFVHPDDRQVVINLFDQMSRGKQSSFDIMLRIRVPNQQEYRHVIINCLILNDTDGNVIGYTGIRRDATEEILRNKELAEKTYKTELVTKASGFMPWEYDCQKKIFISADNDEFGREMSLDDYIDLTHHNDREKLQNAWNIMRDGRDENFSIDLKYRHHDKWMYATIAGEPYENDSHGRVIRYLGYRNDTTDLALMNESIRASKFKTDMAMKNANMVMWEYDVDEQMFTAFNDPLTNYDITAKYSPEDYIKALDPSSVTEATKAVVLMNERRVGEFSFKSKIMLPDSTQWQYINVYGSHSEVEPENPTRATKYLGFRVNNTELVKLTQGLEESNVLTMSILAQSPSSVFIKDISNEWRYIIANDLFCQIFNYTEDQILGYTDHEIFSKDVADKFHEDDLKAAGYDGIYSFVEQVITDGIVKALHTTKRMITTSNGRQLLIGITSDISETVAQQKALEQANEKSELILNNANTGLVYIDNDFRIIWENADSVTNNPHIDKYRRGGVCYQSIHGLNEPCKDCVIQRAQKSLNTEKITKTFSDGTILDIYATPVIGEQKQINGYVCRLDNVTRDVIRTKQIENTQKYLDMAIDAGNVAVWGYDPKENVIFNISGRVFKQDVLPFEQALDCIHPDDLPKFIEIWEEIVSGKSDNENICLRFISPITGKIEYIDKSITSLRSASGELDMIIGTHHDVTEQQMQKIALEDSNEKLNMALDVIQAFSWHCDMRDKILRFDSNFVSLGLNPEAMNSMEKFALHIHPEERAEFLDIILDALAKDDGEFISTYRIDLRSDGCYEWWECRGKIKIMSDNDQTYKYIYGMDCNITHHKQITEELTKAKTDSDNAYVLLNNIIQQIPLGLFIKDIDNDLRYIMVNDKLANFHNMQTDQFIGKTDFEIMPAEKAEVMCNDNQTAISMNGDVFVKTLSSPINSVTQISELTEVMCTNSDGRRMLIGLMANISEREKNRLELQKSKEEAEEANALLQSIIKQIPFGLYIKDISNDFRYVIMNDVLAKIDRIDGKSAIGKTDYELFSKEIADTFREGGAIALTRPDGELSVIKSCIDWHGQKSVYENSDTVITVANDRRLLVGVVADITEKEHMLSELKIAKERAEQSDKLKSAFLANMSHEIRTPLNAIVGFSELLIEAEDATEREEYTNIISVNNELLLRLIGDILDLSKIESGMIELKTELFDLSDICDEVYMMLKQKVTNPKIDFTIDNPYHSCMVRLDKNRLKQVGINFITNAIKYTAEGLIKMGYRYVNNGIRIYVEDSGIGISKDNHSKVFKRFEKFDSFAQGTGLGLSICKAIMDAQEGEIGFDSEEGKGSTFWAWFPCEADITEITPQAETQMDVEDNVSTELPSHSSELKILIAEDNDSNYLLMRHILKDYNLTRVCNGAEAVDIATNEKFNIILMDWKMPIMDGLQATRKIREFDKTTPIIAVTANAFDSNRVSIIEAGCNAFVAKPMKKQELFDVLNMFW